MGSITTNIKDLYLSEDRFISDPEKELSSTKIMELVKTPEMISLDTTGLSLHEPPNFALRHRTEEDFKEYYKRYNYWVRTLDTVLYQLKHQKSTQFNDLYAIAHDMINYYSQDPNYVLNLMNNRVVGDHDNYVALHSVHVAILSLGIGMKAQYPTELLLELVIGALLHDLGHTKTFKRYMVTEYLESDDIEKYDKHVLVGLALLRNLSQVPLTTAIIMLQHHEYYNGAGRIFMSPPERIHEFSSIVQTANTFESRCRFHNPNRSLAFFIKDAKLGHFKKEIQNHLLTLLSLYPIGSYVINENSEICKVIGANGTQLTAPILQSLFSYKNGKLEVLTARQIYNNTPQNQSKVVKSIFNTTLLAKLSLGF